MTIRQYLQSISKKELSQINSLQVRELEAVGKGRWIAFIDDKEHSFDQSVLIKGNNVEQILCDCDPTKTSCLHRLAMLMAINTAIKGEKKKVAITKRKAPIVKLTPAQRLLQEKDKDLVYAWLVDLFEKNKEVEQHFILNFQDKETISYTTSSVETIIKNAFSSVIGKRKTADAPLIKSLVDMLELALEPVQTYIGLQVYTTEGFELFHTIGEQVIRFKYSVSFTSKRTEKLIENIATFYAHSLLNIKDSVLVEKALCAIVEDVFIANQPIRNKINLILLSKLLESDTKQYKEVLAKELAMLLEKIAKKKQYLDASLALMILKYFIKEDLFQQYYLLFTPITYENKYNLALIENLLTLDIALAKKYALACIDSNVKKEYNVAYQLILNKIYVDSQDYQGQAHLAMTNFSSESHIDDYKLIQEYFGGTPEFKKFRTLTFSRLRNSFLYTPNACLLYFQILELDFDYKRMMELIDHKVNFDVVFVFAEDLMRFDKDLFLEKVLTAGQFGTYNIVPSEALAHFIVKNYEHRSLRFQLMVKTGSFHSLNKRIEEVLAVGQQK